jgi:hypothetical protein
LISGLSAGPIHLTVIRGYEQDPHELIKKEVSVEKSVSTKIATKSADFGSISVACLLEQREIKEGQGD